jgi:methanogenic corrinoid protein MtbC1
MGIPGAIFLNREDPDSQADLTVIRNRLRRRFKTLLGQITPSAASAYESFWPVMANRVNEIMGSREDIDRLIGGNPQAVMRTNHSCHGSFMRSMLRLGSISCLLEVCTWVYRSYIARGFQPEYFLCEMEAWKQAIGERIHQAADGKCLKNFYQGMIDSHEDFLALSRLEPAKPEVDMESDPLVKHFLDTLLAPSEREAENVMLEQIRNASELPRWWERVVTPSLHAVGRLWAMGEITVAQEHMATEIAQRVMNRRFPQVPRGNGHRGRAAVVVPPGERHTVGAGMVRDCMELSGFEVLYTGADTPIDSVVRMVELQEIDALLISTTMPYNLPEVRELIQEVREASMNSTIECIVGGLAYTLGKDLWKDVGADRHIGTLQRLSEYYSHKSHN